MSNGLIFGVDLIIVSLSLFSSTAMFWSSLLIFLFCYVPFRTFLCYLFRLSIMFYYPLLDIIIFPRLCVCECVVHEKTSTLTHFVGSLHFGADRTFACLTLITTPVCVTFVNLTNFINPINIINKVYSSHSKYSRTHTHTF